MTEAERFFFVHIMRTGGASLSRQLELLYRPREFFPDPSQDDEFHANLDIDNLTGLPPERARELRVITGHFPFYVTELLPFKVRTMSILREPVARTISVLQSKQLGTRVTLPRLEEDFHDPFKGRELEDLYDDAHLRTTMLDNFQTRQFSLRPDDGVRSCVDPIAIDASRLVTAKRNLGKLDVLGLHERYPEAMAIAIRSFGWQIHADAAWHVSEPVRVPESFRARIAADNAHDVDLYQSAVEQYEERLASASS